MSSDFSLRKWAISTSLFVACGQDPALVKDPVGDNYKSSYTDKDKFKMMKIGQMLSNSSYWKVLEDQFIKEFYESNYGGLKDNNNITKDNAAENIFEYDAPIVSGIGKEYLDLEQLFNAPNIIVGNYEKNLKPNVKGFLSGLYNFKVQKLDEKYCGELVLSDGTKISELENLSGNILKKFEKKSNDEVYYEFPKGTYILQYEKVGDANNGADKITKFFYQFNKSVRMKRIEVIEDPLPPVVNETPEGALETPDVTVTDKKYEWKIAEIGEDGNESNEYNTELKEIICVLDEKYDPSNLSLIGLAI